MKTKNKIFGICLLVICGSLGCKKFVEVGAPTTQLVTTSVFNSDAAATAAQLVVYAKMNTEPANIDKYTGLSADELSTYYISQNYTNLFANNLLATDAAFFNEWASGYTYIYYENAILENLPISNGISPKVRQQLSGEAYFMRAYWYFYLTNLYGDVPLILTTDYKTNTAMSRTPQVQVYQQVINDLVMAQASLNPNYVDASDTTVTVDRARPTSSAASALLARVYLYAGDLTHDASYYQKAEAAAKVVIDNTAQFSLSPLSGANSVFKKNSSEAIWQIIPSIGGGYTAEANTFIILTAPPPNSPSGSFTLNTQLLNSFEAGDQRQGNWVGSVKDSKTGLTYYFSNKYKSPNTTPTPTTEYSMILRLAEQYLIRAEARSQQNNLPGAVADINIIRNRAGLSPLPISLTKDLVLSAVAQERRVELFSEGHRWFDLKRTGQVDAIMSTATQQKGGTWKSYQQLYPIPQESINNGLNIKQNQGY